MAFAVCRGCNDFKKDCLNVGMPLVWLCRKCRNV